MSHTILPDLGPLAGDETHQELMKLTNRTMQRGMAACTRGDYRGCATDFASAARVAEHHATMLSGLDTALSQQWRAVAVQRREFATEASGAALLREAEGVPA